MTINQSRCLEEPFKKCICLEEKKNRFIWVKFGSSVLLHWTHWDNNTCYPQRVQCTRCARPKPHPIYICIYNK